MSETQKIELMINVALALVIVFVLWQLYRLYKGTGDALSAAWDWFWGPPPTVAQKVYSNSHDTVEGVPLGGPDQGVSLGTGDPSRGVWT